MKAKDFIKKLKFVEALDTEMSADRQDTAELDKNEDDVAPVATPKGIDTSDPQILSVMNGYFRHINELEAGAKGAELQDLCHRMVNVMLEMPGGEKALRGALKGAVKGLGIERGVNENKDQALQLQSKIDAIKKQQDDTKIALNKDPKGAGADALKKKIETLGAQISALQDQKKTASKNESQGDVLDKNLIHEADKDYKALKLSLSGVNEFLKSAKPDHAMDNDELKSSIDEAKKLKAHVDGLRYITI